MCEYGFKGFVCMVCKIFLRNGFKVIDLPTSVKNMCAHVYRDNKQHII